MPGVSLRVGVLVAQLCARVPGGTGRYTRELVTALESVRTPGQGLYAVAPRGCAPAGELPVPVTSLRLPALALSRLWERGLPPRVATSGVVHAPTLLLPPARGGVALVVTCHDVVPWTHPETLTPRGVRFHVRMGARAAREVDLIITPTEAVARQVRQHLAPACEVRPVLSGSSSLTLPGDAGRRRDTLGFSRPYVLFVGTAEPRKGLDVLTGAMAGADLADLDLVVVGPAGWGGVSVASLADRAGLGDRVHVTGRLSDEDLAAAYAGARVVAMPSRAEGFGLPVVEAMTFGVPAVTSDDAALAEVGGGATLVTPVGDVDALAAALATAAADGPERTTLVDAGRARVAELSWSTAARQMWQAYADVGA